MTRVSPWSSGTWLVRATGSALTAVAVLLSSGCSPGPTSGTTNTAAGSSGTGTVTGAPAESPSPTSGGAVTDAGPVATGTPPRMTNSLAGSSAHHRLPVDGETFGMRVDYWSTTPAAGWSATGSQDLHLAAYLSGSPRVGTQVLLDHFSSDWLLQSTLPALDGTPLLAAVDRPSGGVAGFALTTAYPFASVISRTGVGDDLISRWSAVGGAPRLLTDAAVRQAGGYALLISLRYQLLIKSTGEPNWHRRTVTDQLTVPVASTG